MARIVTFRLLHYRALDPVSPHHIMARRKSPTPPTDVTPPTSAPIASPSVPDAIAKPSLAPRLRRKSTAADAAGQTPPVSAPAAVPAAPAAPKPAPQAK